MVGTGGAGSAGGGPGTTPAVDPTAEVARAAARDAIIYAAGQEDGRSALDVGMAIVAVPRGEEILGSWDFDTHARASPLALRDVRALSPITRTCTH